MKKTAIYIRVSHEEQVQDGYSIDAQKEALTKYAKENNLYIVGYYIDEGISARKNILHRKELQRLVDDIKNGKIDLILFTKLDRWFRSISDYYRIQEILEKYNVNWKTILEDYDTTTAGGRLHINIMLSVAQDEADRTSERIKFVFDEKVRNGEAISGSVPFGYKIEDKKVIIDKEKEPIVRNIYDYFEIDNSIRETMKYINAKYKTDLTYPIIQRIITNKQYTGSYRGNDNYCKPYLSVTRYKKLQRLIKKNRRVGKAKHTYIFSGLLICEDCGRRLAGNSTINSYGTLYKQYRCAERYINDGCINSKTTNEKKIEKYLLENIEKELDNYIVSIDIEEARHEAIDNSKEINRKLERLKELYVNEMITMDEFRTDQEKIKSQLIVSKPKEKVNINELRDFINSDFKSIYSTLNDKEKQSLWRSVIDRIIVRGSKVKTIFFV